MGIDNILKLNKKKQYIILLAIITVLAFFLNFYSISNYGYGNEYYSAAVLSMTKSFKNFFFVSFDPSGMVSVDKPPLGLWIQAIFVLMLGFKGWVLMLPQAIAGTASCIMIYLLISKYHSRISALIASFIFAATPIVVAVSRNNTIDMQLVFVLLLAVWFLFKSIDNNRPGCLIIAGIFIGLGFNIKMLQVYMVIPAFVSAYLLFAKQKLSKKLTTGIITTIVMLVVSLSWASIVELYPASERPYVDSTSNNSVFELIVGHNGTERILGRDQDNSYNESSSEHSKNTPTKNSSDDYIGNPSPLRLWITNIYGQISWLFIMVLASIISCTKKISIKALSMKNVSFIFWEIWFFTMFIFFSFAGFYHRYYLCMMAPAIAALCGIGIPNMFKDFKERSSWRQFILPISFIVTIALELIHISQYDNLPAILKPIVLISSAVCLILMMLHYFKKNKKHLISLTWLALFIAVFSAPLYWAVTPVLYVPSLVKPSAGPDIKTTDTAASSGKGAVYLNDDFSLQQYLVSHYKKDSFLAVSPRSIDIAKLIINTGLPAYAYGGFLGNDNSMTLDELKRYLEEGKITYFLFTNDDEDSEIIDYVKEHATLIDESEYKNKFEVSMDNKKNKKSLYYFGNDLKNN